MKTYDMMILNILSRMLSQTLQSLTLKKPRMQGNSYRREYRFSQLFFFILVAFHRLKADFTHPADPRLMQDQIQDCQLGLTFSKHLSFIMTEDRVEPCALLFANLGKFS
jgi:hypothetical protein